MVFTALQTGTFDGQENPLSIADAASIQTIQKYVTHWNGIYESLFLCMNKTLYDSLTPELQKLVDQCGRQAIEFQRQTSRDAEKTLLEQWAAAHVTVTELTEDQAKVFRKAAQPCYDQFAQNVSEELLADFGGR
jgi:C4-dicarboxylate transporter DctM subunit